MMIGLLSAVLCVTGCQPAGKPSGSAVVSSALSAPENDGPLVPYEKTVTMTQTKYTIDLTTYIDGEDEGDNFIRDFYKDKLNLVWKNVWSSNSESYMTRIGLSIASGDLPDVFLVNKFQLQYLIQSGSIMDLKDIYESYVSDNLRANIEFDDGIALQAATVDDHLYAIPVTKAYESSVAFMWIRTDWMNRLHLQPPTTYAQLVDYIRTMKSNGIAGENRSGFMFSGPGSISFDGLVESFGAYYSCWLKKRNGSGLVYGTFEPEMRNALSGMQELFAEGLIDHDFAINSTDLIRRLKDNQVGLIFGEFYYPALLKYSVAADPEATWDAYPLVCNPDGEIKPKTDLFVSNYIVVNKKCKNPEALIKSMNLWAQVWLEDGIYRDWYTEQMTTRYSNIVICGEYALPYFFEGVDNVIKIGKMIRSIYSTSSPDETISQYPFAKITYSFITNRLVPNYILGEGWSLKKVYTSSEKVFADYYNNMQMNEFQGSLSCSAYNEDSLWNRKIIETFINIIMGDPIEYFDQLQQEWYGGGNKICSEVNSWYAKYQSP